MIVLAFFGPLVVAMPLGLSLPLMLIWLVSVRYRIKLSNRHCNWNRSRLDWAIQITGMILIIVAAYFAPFKESERAKLRRIELPKLEMTLDELTVPSHYDLPRYYLCTIKVPEAIRDQVIRFPARALTVGSFIDTIESQTPLRHEFHHCGNGYSILRGGDCSFGLWFD
jgi:hypothetical protein